ncbi:MAG: hypothetical protein IPN07_07625 [Dehalococcoidia bacterium]|nr:hypothetical protein [Dehalococcoidia bacterium]
MALSRWSSFVDVDDGRGTRRIAGDWVLELKPPADLTKALRVETLSPGAVAAAQGITVRPLSATRSTTETLVTVALEGPPGIEQLAPHHWSAPASMGAPCSAHG